MADMAKEDQTEVNRLAEPCEKEGEILEGNQARDAALKKVEEAKVEKKLPKLSAAEFRVYNSMAEHMEYFHNHFRQSWTILKTACDTNRRPANMSLKAFLSTGLSFLQHLETHHSIEEAHIFPVLARKMPEFENGRNAAELLRQHKEIHVGMEKLETYLLSVKSGERELELRVMRERMEDGGWGDVLWTHLDQEVKTLGAENMRKYCEFLFFSRLVVDVDVKGENEYATGCSYLGALWFM
ncbi:hypothetical protein LSUB1_G002841 [Lachnellula subtilissima]|uniref:Hemerythrin-like domain-containing protein n=1 Tax=Lachnellula subtilissima TaxID=602034 RepID=A0A8H8U950_9HELO|nr:hypothetical protein LSUB1_G002841 [Lachnellula subtilissima]